MKIPDSGKIVIGVIGAALLIAGLHLGLYKKRADEYSQSRTRHSAVMGQYAQLGGARPLNEINAFRYANMSYAEEYWKLIRDLGVVIPDRYFPLTKDERAQRQDFWDLLAYLEKHRNDGLKPNPFFLGAQGWDLATTLPQEFLRSGVNIVDAVEKLRNDNEVLKVLDASSALYTQTEQNYSAALAVLGMNLDRIDQIRAQYGDLAATVHSLNRLRIIREALPANYFGSLSEEQVEQQLYELFRIEFPIDPDPVIAMFPYYRQATNLRQLIDLAREAEVEYITYVRMWDPRDSFFTEPPTVAAATATAAPAGRGNQGGVDPRFQQDWDEEPDFGEPGSRGGGNQSSAAAADAKGAPMQVTYYATNASSMEFLDQVARSRVPMELDKLAISEVRDPGAENFQKVDMVVNGLVLVPGLFFLPDNVDREIVKAIRERYELGVKAGGRDLAVKDGIMDGNGTILVPSPTPFPES
ncbi:MAG: hypothetical protein SF028_09170 [Candidatus Sumerlaeia bacterium]|nr:hypothetical protein [Candidatus Sumerlaeia bacterium]